MISFSDIPRTILSYTSFNQTTGILLYWVPLSFCVIFYTLRTAKNYMSDKKCREDNSDRYYPTDTIGDVVGRAIVSIIPIANIWASLFDLAPNVFGNFFSYLSRVLSQPLVPEKKKQ